MCLFVCVCVKYICMSVCDSVCVYLLKCVFVILIHFFFNAEFLTATFNTYFLTNSEGLYLTVCL